MRQDYKLGLPLPGIWKEVLNSDDKAFGGTGLHHNASQETVQETWNGRPYTVSIGLPPLGVVVLELAEHKAPARKKTAAKTSGVKAGSAKSSSPKAAAAKTALKPAAKPSSGKAGKKG